MPQGNEQQRNQLQSKFIKRKEKQEQRRAADDDERASHGMETLGRTAKNRPLDLDNRLHRASLTLNLESGPQIGFIVFGRVQHINVKSNQHN